MGLMLVHLQRDVPPSNEPRSPSACPSTDPIGIYSLIPALWSSLGTHLLGIPMLAEARKPGIILSDFVLYTIRVLAITFPPLQMVHRDHFCA